MVEYEVSLTVQFVVIQNLALNSKCHLNSKANMFWVQYMLSDTQQFRLQVTTQFKVSICLKMDLNIKNLSW